MIDLLKQKKTWFRLCVALLVIPAGCWYLLLTIGFFIPKSEEKTGLQIPRATPREGYEIIFPYLSGHVSGAPNTDIFYYLNNKRQVIYRYDENRYLELQGEDCQGLIWYHNDELDIHTRIDDYFFTHERMPLQYQYFNPGQEFIGIPTGNLSTVMVSLDYGKTFFAARVSSYAAVPGEDVLRFVGLDEPRLTVSYNAGGKYMYSVNMKDMILGKTGFFILKNNNVLFGDEWSYRDNWQPESTYYSLNGIIEYTKQFDAKKAETFGAAYKILSKKARDRIIEPYEGWDRIRCEVGAER